MNEFSIGEFMVKWVISTVLLFLGGGLIFLIADLAIHLNREKYPAGPEEPGEAAEEKIGRLTVLGVKKPGPIPGTGLHNTGPSLVGYGAPAGREAQSGSNNTATVNPATHEAISKKGPGMHVTERIPDGPTFYHGMKAPMAFEPTFHAAVKAARGFPYLSRERILNDNTILGWVPAAPIVSIGNAMVRLPELPVFIEVEGSQVPLGGIPEAELRRIAAKWMRELTKKGRKP